MLLVAGMQITRHSTDNIFERNYGYSRAVRAGPFIFVSGTTAADEALNGDVSHQFASAASRVESSLAHFGATMADIVRTIVYVRDITEIDAISAAHAAIFGAAPPASTVVEVTGLAPQQARVELEVTAIATA